MSACRRMCSTLNCEDFQDLFHFLITILRLTKVRKKQIYLDEIRLISTWQSRHYRL